MAIEGFLEATDRFQIRGWAFESELPSHHVKIEIFLQQQLLTTTIASLYRDDLEQSGLGSGDHAFIVNLDRALSASDEADILVFAITIDGNQQLLNRLTSSDEKNFSSCAPLQFDSDSVDADQHPVFILGAARSGTSAVAQGLLKLKRFSGHEEGHILDLMAHLLVGTENFYVEKSDDMQMHKNTTVSLIPRAYVSAALDNLFIEMIRKLYPSGVWLDKTPNPNMIFLAPIFLRIWPNSRFIFMKRRPVENIASRMIKFPSINFSEHCKEWHRTMSAWLEIRPQLPGAAIEIDQQFLDKQPKVAAIALQKFLSLTDEQTLHLEQAFEFDHPERTSISTKDALILNEMGWSADKLQFFNEMCTSLMPQYGYGQGVEYFARGIEYDGLIWL